MIIREDKSYETNSLFPNTDWYNEGNYIIDETTELGKRMAQTYIENYPFVEFEHDGKLVTKVIVLEKPEKPPELPGKQIVLKQDEEGNWYYEYEDIPKSKEEIQDEIISLLGQEIVNLKLESLEKGTLIDTLGQELTNIKLQLIMGGE